MMDLISRFLDDESGQGITEYGAILAFVAVLIGIIFTFKGTLTSAVSNAFSSVAAQLNTMANAATTPS